MPAPTYAAHSSRRARRSPNYLANRTHASGSRGVKLASGAGQTDTAHANPMNQGGRRKDAGRRRKQEKKEKKNRREEEENRGGEGEATKGGLAGVGV